MIISNPDALKSWLSVILQPLCDADPSALARYVFALLKKDKPVKDLKKTMTDQLDVFLGEETKSFIERLFSAIASEEYLTQQAPAPPEIEANITTTNDSSIKLDKECTPPLVNMRDIATTNQINVDVQQHQPQGAPHVSKEFKIDLSNSVVPTEELHNVPAPPILGSTSISPSKAASDKENQPRESRRRRPSMRSRSRSRSRSFDRARRSRSRDRKISDREKNSRQFRNKSPPADRRRIDRRPIDRSPRSFGKTRTKSHSASRSRSGSPERRKISRSSSPSPNENNRKRQRCRDFDQKGYCVRGETCPWDHGVNPVVLEDLNTPALLSMQPHLREYNPDAPELWNRSGTFPGPRAGFPHKNAAIPGAYPRPPGIGFRPVGPPFPFPVNPAATTPLQRELISVPVVDANIGGDVSAVQAKRRYEPEESVAIAEGPTKRKIPINSRLGPRVAPQQNCSLELRKIPRGMNTIAHLNNHFSKFGKIVNIQISYDGDPEAAIVTFSTHAEANVAYRSTEAVLNNRFIKVFWHSPGSSGDPTMGGGPPIKEDTIINGRKQSQYHLNNIPAVPTPAAEGAKTAVSAAGTNAATSSATTTTTTTTSLSNTTTTVAAVAQTPGTLRIKNIRIGQPSNAIIRKKQEEQVKAAVQLAHGLHKRKHELLQNYLKQMRSAVELVERVDHNDPQRQKMLDTIKELQESIDRLRKEISTEQAQIAAQIQNQPPAKKSKEQQKKELLDIELELIAQQQEGNDTSAIQKRIEELQRSLGISSKPHFNKRNARIRAGPPGTTSVDRRPTALLISGFAKEDSDMVLAHFKHLGEITKHDLDKNIPQLTIVYATRGVAEQAVVRGRLFKEKHLQIAWAPQAQPQIQQQVLSQPSLQKADNGTTEIVQDKKAEPLPELRLEDEEEEEDAESEERSWRR